MARQVQRLPHFYQRECQDEVNQGVRDYPSLDAATQRAITKRYQALHERVKNEGYYDCRYVEYGKEFLRYSFLFGCFFGLLQAGWYIPSACFLGAFWVCHPTPSPYSTQHY
jgi:delta8-fatty-acid desaturase